jgi:YD repeat-containing protein
MNRLTSQTADAGYAVSFAYWAMGQRTNMVDAGGTTVYQYDCRDRLTNKYVSWTNGTSVALNYSYDPNGNVSATSSSTSGGVNLAYYYDPLNRLKSVYVNTNPATTWYEIVVER